MSFSLYRALVQPLRTQDTTELLKRFLQGPQLIRDARRAEILTLYDQIKPAKVRSDLLRELAAIVGFTADLRSIIDRLSEVQLRKLIALAVPMWNERNTVKGLVNAIRLLTGRAAFVSTWFSYRAIVGEATLTEDQLLQGGDFWVIGGQTSTYDETWSNIRIMDDGGLDELLLIDIAKLERPLGERFELFLCDFLDRFDATLDKWTTISGTDPSIVDHTMLLPASTAVKPIIPLITDQSTNKDYNIVTKFKLDPGGKLKVRWYTQTDGLTNGTAFEVVIQGVAPHITYKQYHGGLTITTETSNAIEIFDDVWYKLRISTVNAGLDREHRILIDGNLMFSNAAGAGFKYVDTADADTTPGSGYYLFQAQTADVRLDNIESWRNPARFATVETGDVVTMSSNFVEE